MKIKFIAISLLLSSFAVSCGENEKSEHKTDGTHSKTEHKKEEKKEHKEEAKANSSDDGKGVGPITSVELGAIDEALVEKGKEIYKTNCTACHKIGKRAVGPALKGVTERRSPEWIMNMILNPDEMVEKDPTAKALLEEYLAPTANQSLSEEDARAVLEFFRTKN